MVDSYLDYVEPVFGGSLDVDLSKIEETDGDGDDALTMAHSSGLYKGSDKSLSLNIQDSGAGNGRDRPGTRSSACTTLNTTAATNSPVNNGNGLASPDFNCFGKSTFETADLLSTPASRPKYGCDGDGDQQQQQQQQQQSVDSFYTNATAGTANVPLSLSTAARNYTSSNSSNYSNNAAGDNNDNNSSDNNSSNNNNSSNLKLKREKFSHAHTLSTPTAMNDFIAMLDAQSAIQEQFDINSNANSDLSSSNDFIMTNSRKERDSSSPLQNTSSSSSQFIDPNLLKSNLFVDTFTQPYTDEIYGGQARGNNISSLLDEYVSTDLLINDNISINEKISHMHSNNTVHDRRHSDVVTNPVPEFSNNRNSISHEIDFWSLPDRRNTINGSLVDPKVGRNNNDSSGKEGVKTKSNFDMDTELNQVLND
ncbi:hypothetical protein HG535_0C05560 [Zygotorulaspora mrakii]|uniref:Uncharacterized protein n=1 Tax=Zygotorulaspora mrakii TaxID=42260 RepID=A0A7H9B373_ZYGMR|nr:uncharacterized protein HG535_0C05560 [Zygotorulaspora mrakii]QLG72202.1 hypothetical protein HG535_0C05560 [Zygotorulaspora mrakii]